MSCSVDKVACMGFYWKFNLHPLLVNHVAWGRWKTLVHGLPPASESWIILQAFFPSPASVSQVISETSRWWGESKGWGLQIATMFWDRYKLSDLKTDNPDIRYVLFWSNSLRSFQLRSALCVFISIFLISIGQFYFATLGHYHFALTRTLWLRFATIIGYNLPHTGKIAPGLVMPGDEGGGSFPQGKVNH